MKNFKYCVKRFLRHQGWELRRFDPDASLDAFLWMMFHELRVNCVIDVGAREGEFATHLRTNGYRDWILSFDPVEANFERLERNSSRDKTWRAYRLALGSQNETKEINV